MSAHVQNVRYFIQHTFSRRSSFDGKIVWEIASSENNQTGKQSRLGKVIPDVDIPYYEE